MSKVNNSLSVLNVSLCNLVNNYDVILRSGLGKRIAAVVKANAYGIGYEEVSRSLFNKGCNEFYVSSLDEAIALRKSLPQAEIFVLHGINKGEEYYFLEHKLIPVICSFDQLALWKSAAKKIDISLPANIMFDTGMNRLGFLDEAVEIVEREINDGFLKIKYLMSHLACANDVDHVQNQQQLKSFSHILAAFTSCKTSLINSDGLFLDQKYLKYDQSRVGIVLYGIGDRAKKLGLRNVVELNSEIIQLQQIDREGFVGYGAKTKVSRGMKIATIPFGYADFSLLLKNDRIKYKIGEYSVKSIGEISMDLTTLDVSEIPDSKLHVGQKVEIFGKNISIESVAKMTDTKVHAILTSIGPRVKRNYVS